MQNLAHQSLSTMPYNTRPQQTIPHQTLPTEPKPTKPSGYSRELPPTPHLGMVPRVGYGGVGSGRGVCGYGLVGSGGAGSRHFPTNPCTTTFYETIPRTPYQTLTHHILLYKPDPKCGVRAVRPAPPEPPHLSRTHRRSFVRRCAQPPQLTHAAVVDETCCLSGGCMYDPHLTA